MLVKVTTDQGLEGWGEAFGFRAVKLAKLAIDELIAQLCIGQGPTHIAPLMLDVQKKPHIFGRSGPVDLWPLRGEVGRACTCRVASGCADLVLVCGPSESRDHFFKVYMVVNVSPLPRSPRSLMAASCACGQTSLTIRQYMISIGRVPDPIAYLAGASESRYKTGFCTRCRSNLISLWADR